MRRRRRERIKRTEKRLKGKVTFRTIFLLAVTLIFNTYAWFLYVNTVSADLTAHVDAWQVMFEVDGQTVDRSFVFNITHAYPGMTNATKTITVTNSGEKIADIEYEVRYVRIFDDEYIATEAVSEGETVPVGATTASASQLLTMIGNTYPFEITLSGTSATLDPEDDTSLTITFSWAYESGQDAADTTYGVTAYDFYEDNPGTPAIEIIIKVIASQSNS